VLICYLWK